ncbi:MAG: nucleotidyltransferase domain-containing protein [Anaerosomatales bacterium]|nr:nucleotidyltransferase domain-containing protein [Coriobacteriia bacterium]MDI6691807.1 nucleotidyltransferase domain-containing protein [Anaerosomatales bacterium]MDI6842951.1 nucleotidyltransferase domain-containing protein [Anaerosomatales bacterium]
MASILQEKKQAITEACRRFKVARMYVFGSALRDDFSLHASDIDLLVEFEDMSPFELVDAYFGLLAELERILDSPVDLVMADAVKNRYIAADIERTRRLMYAA